MTSPLAKAKQWIEEKKDPRSAHWQAGLESVLELFLPDMEKGRLIPVRGLEERETPLFESALAQLDLSPNVYAAFLTASAASAIAPPDSAEELERIDRSKPSCKIIILRPGEERRILCAEISEQAHRPGIDIFQSGALLGTYNYENSEDCMDGLKKAIKAHAWKKETWREDDYLGYTLNWFDRVRTLNTSDVSVDKNLSFLHSPTLIKASPADALFQLIYLLLAREYQAPEFLQENPQISEKIAQKDVAFCRALAENHIFDLLNTIKELDLLDFKQFHDKESKTFQTEFQRAREKLRALLMHLKQIK